MVDNNIDILCIQETEVEGNILSFKILSNEKLSAPRFKASHHGFEGIPWTEKGFNAVETQGL